MNLRYLRACGSASVACGLAVIFVRVEEGNFEETIINAEHISLQLQYTNRHNNNIVRN
jgi:hypothetical protein